MLQRGQAGQVKAVKDLWGQTSVEDLQCCEEKMMMAEEQDKRIRA